MTAFTQATSMRSSTIRPLGTLLTRGFVGCMLGFPGLALAGNLGPPPPTGPPRVVPYYLVAMVEVTCKVPVFSEMWGADRLQASLTVPPPTSCDLESLAGWMRTHLEDCSYVVSTHDTVLQVRPGLASAEGCVAAPSRLDVTSAGADLSGGNDIFTERMDLSTMFIGQISERGPDTIGPIVEASATTTFRNAMIRSVAKEPPAWHQPTTLDVILFGSAEAPMSFRGRSGMVFERYVGGAYNGAGELADGPYSYRTQWWKAPGEIRWRPYTKEESAALTRLSERVETREITESEAAVQRGAIWQATIIGGDQDDIDASYELSFGAHHFNAKGEDRRLLREDAEAVAPSPSSP